MSGLVLFAHILLLISFVASRSTNQDSSYESDSSSSSNSASSSSRSSDETTYRTFADSAEATGKFGLGVFTAVAAAEAIADELIGSSEEDDDDEAFPPTVDNFGTKRFGFLPVFNPANFFDPIADKISAFLNKPPWNKFHQWGGGADNAIFGLGQIGGHDYPFPYRQAIGRNARSFLKDKLDDYKDAIQSKLQGPKNLSTALDYFFPYLVNAERVKEVATNATSVLH